MTIVAIEIDGEPTAVYRLFDAEDVLLRVGITRHIPARFAQYKAEADWWPQVARKTMIWYGSRSEALAVEAAAILAESPVHNIIGKVPVPERGAGTDRHREKPLSLRFGAPMRAELETFARATGQAVRGVIADAVTDWLDEHESTASPSAASSQTP